MTLSKNTLCDNLFLKCRILSEKTTQLQVKIICAQIFIPINTLWPPYRHRTAFCTCCSDSQQVTDSSFLKNQYLLSCSRNPSFMEP
jgi:hypothetical protein